MPRGRRWRTAIKTASRTTSREIVGVTSQAIFGPPESCENGPSAHEGAMKKTRFTEEQMVTIFREADTKPVPEVAKKHCVSAQTIYA